LAYNITIKCDTSKCEQIKMQISGTSGTINSPRRAHCNNNPLQICENQTLETSRFGHFWDTQFPRKLHTRVWIFRTVKNALWLWQVWNWGVSCCLFMNFIGLSALNKLCHFYEPYIKHNFNDAHYKNVAKLSVRCGHDDLKKLCYIDV